MFQLGVWRTVKPPGRRNSEDSKPNLNVLSIAELFAHGEDHSNDSGSFLTDLALKGQGGLSCA